MSTPHFYKGIQMIAIYCRQSVEKKDSISIETQEQECRLKLRAGEESFVRVYADRGYSGKDTNRPGFKQMILDVERGTVTKIIVYKIDRMSRSVLDFELIYRELKEHGVDFVSATEDFDTTSITGEAMLRVILIFAQMERETTQKRVSDNFYSRAERGFFLAGSAPIGYIKVPDCIDSKKTSRLEENPETSCIIRFIYRSYLSGRSIGEIVAALNSPECEIKHDLQFSNVRISRILGNPVYVRANADVYAYFKSRGAVLHNDVSEFSGVCGCTVYGRRQGKKKSKFRDLFGENIQLNRHEGLISADDWLMVQCRINDNKTLRNIGCGTHSWLSGLIKCGWCGYAASVVSGQRNGKRYVYCGGKKNKLCCHNKLGITFDDIENAVAEKIIAHARELHFHSSYRSEADDNEVNSLKALRIKLEDEISEIVDSFTQAENALLRGKLNERMVAIEKRINDIDNRISKISVRAEKTMNADSIIPLLEDWENLEMSDKKAIARLMISRVTIWDKKTPIEVVFYV